MVSFRVRTWLQNLWPGLYISSHRKRLQRRKIRSLSLVQQLEDRTLLTYGPALVLDINTVEDAASAGIWSLVEMNGVAYFTATTPTAGTELWRTDGTEAGTWLVKDIYPGTTGSSPTSLTVVGDTLYFRASHPLTGAELWKTDGTEEGTALVKDIYPGTSSASPTYMTPVGSTLYFRASQPDTGTELWKTDGTEGGTALVADLGLGASSSSPDELIEFQGILVFTANSTGPTGRQVYRTDGTHEGTTAISEVVAGSIAGFGTNFAVSGSRLYYLTNQSTTGWELWRSDGTIAGNQLIDQIPATEGAFYLTPFRDGVLFTLNSGNYASAWFSDGTTEGTGPFYATFPGATYTVEGSYAYFAGIDSPHGQELFRTDGTPAGTTLVSDIAPGTSPSWPSSIQSINGQLYFVARNTTVGAELWTSDGTVAGTQMVADFYPGSTGSSPGQLINVDGTLYFTAFSAATGTEVYRLNDSTIELVADIRAGGASSSPTLLNVIGGKLFLVANDGVTGSELWCVNDSGIGVTLVKNTRGTTDSNPSSLIDINGTLYFRATNGINGEELWTSDGTAAGTSMVADLYAGSVSSSPNNLVNVAGTLYFFATDSANGQELRRLNGSTIELVADIRPGATGSSPTSLTNVNGTLYFLANDGTHGTELWKSDGTPEGTELVADLTPGSGSSSLTQLTVVGNTLYFVFGDGVHGEEVWKSDGTAAGTQIVRDIRPGATGSSPTSLISHNGLLYFRANDGTSGDELWQSDGTSAGTRLVVDLVPGSGGSFPTQLVSFEGQLFFGANTIATGSELWVTNGTASGTALVRDIYSGSSSSAPQNLRVVGDMLFFTANDGVHGAELWASDGTEAGTFLVRDIMPDTGLPVISEWASLGGRLYFRLNDYVTGDELWVSDGTRQGTYPLDVLPQGSINPMNLTAVGQRLFFSGVLDATGRELFVYDPTPAGASAPAIQVAGGAEELAPTGETISFGEIQQNSSIIRMVYVRNWGTEDLILQPATVPAGFYVANNFTAGQAVAPGETVSLAIAINTDTNTDYSGPLVIFSNDPNRPSYEITLTGSVNTPQIAVTVDGATTRSEGDTSSLTVTVSRTHQDDLSSGVTVTLTSDNVAAVYAPVSVYIPANVSSVTATLYITNDSLLDGDQQAIITGSASGFANGSSAAITITNDDSQGNLTLGGFLSGALAADDYRVLQNVFVAAGQTWSISPGTDLFFDGGRYLQVSGYLNAVGTEAAPIRFDSASLTPQAGDWGGVRINTDTSAQTSQLRFAEIAHATTGLTISAPDLSVSVAVADSRIHDNSEHGIYVRGYGSHATLALTRSRVDHNGQNGIRLYSSASGGSGTPVSQFSGSAILTMTESEIDHNTAIGVSVEASGTGDNLLFLPNGRAEATLIHNRIHHNQIGLVANVYRSSSGRPDSASVSVIANYNVIDANDNQGVVVTISGPAGLSTAFVNNSILYNGAEGVRHTLNDTDQMTFKNNLVAFNEAGGVVSTVAWTPDSGLIGYNALFANPDEGDPSTNWENYPTSFGTASTTNVNGTAADAEFNITVDPLLVGSGDFHFTGSSLLRNAGVLHGGAPTVDIDGNPHIKQPDIGADEGSPRIGLQHAGMSLVNSISVVDFGTTTWRESGIEQTFSVTNQGSGELYVDPVQFLGSGFSLTSNLSPGQEILPGETVWFSLLMTSFAVGPLSAAVTLTSDALDHPSFSFTLTGEVVPSQPPAISQITSPVEFIEDGTPVLIAGQALISDQDTTDFNLGRLRISWTPDNIATDVWTVNSTGSGPGQISVISDVVRYEGSVVGLLTRGSNSLAVAFSSGTTTAAIQAILRQIVFQSTSQAPSIIDRIATIELDDGHGGIAVPQQVTIQVQPVNDAPTNLILSNSSFPENQPVGTLVGTLSAVDPDSSTGFVYSLSAGTGDGDNALFNVSGNQLATAANFNFETRSTYSIRLRVTDSGGLSFEKAFTISLTNANDAPTNITLTGSTISENLPLQSVIGTFSTTDVDPGNTFTYTLVSGPGDTGNSAFEIAGNVLRTAQILNYEAQNSYSIRVRSTDQGGLSVEISFTVTVVNVNEAPSAIILSNSTVPENLPVGTIIGTLTTVDPEGGPFLWEFAGGVGSADNDLFQIVGNELRTNAVFDFETRSSYSIRVRSWDPGELLIDQVFTVTILNANDPPTNISLSSISVLENLPADSLVGTLSTTDIDHVTGFTYELIPGIGDNHNDSFHIDGNQLLTSQSLDFETQPALSVRVRVTDAGGATFEKSFSITVQNANEPPTGLVLQNVVGTLSETTSTASAITLAGIVITDDALGTNVLSLAGPDAAFFEIVGSALRLKAGTALDFEGQNSYQVTLRVDDAGVGATPDATLDYTLTISDVNEAPTGLVLQNVVSTLSETTSTASAITLADIVITDDALGTNVLSLMGTDAAFFEIVGSELRLRAGASLNFESKSTYQVTVNVDDSTVGITPDATANYTLTISDVNEAPTALTLQNVVSTLIETTSTAGAIKLADLTIADDALGNNVLSLSGPDADVFEIIGTELKLKAGTVLDFEFQSSYQITILVDDTAVGATPDATLDYTLTISQFNAVPTDLALSDVIAELPEDTSTANRIQVAVISFLDDGLGINVLSLSGLDATGFELEGNRLYLRAGTDLDFETKSSYQITINVDDTTVGATPDGTLDYTLTIRDVNEIPTGLTLQNMISTLNENTSTTSAIKLAEFSITDDALGANVLSLSGVDAAFFQIVGNELRLRAGTPLDFESKSTYQVTISVEDVEVGTSPDATLDFTLSVTDINETPSLTVTPVITTLPENTSTASAVTLADIVITDDALGTNVLSLAGPDAAFFEIVGNELRLKAGTVLNFEGQNSYLVTLRVDDTGVGATPDATASYTLTISDVNELPSLSLQNSVTSLPENTSTTSAITLAGIVITDDALGTNVLSLTGTDAAFFEIVGKELRLRAGTALNFESKSTYQVTVSVDDSTVGTTPDATVSYTLTISDVNEPPTALTLQNAVGTLPESTSTTNAVKLADIVITDDALGTNVLSLTGTDAAFFEIVGNELRLKAGTPLNFEAKSSYSVTVAVDDSAVGATPDVTANYTLTISDVNEAPSLSLQNAITSLPENTSTTGAIKLADIIITDDALGANVLSLSGVDAAFFEIIGGELRLKAGTMLNFESKSTYQVTVSVDDAAVGTAPDHSVAYSLTVENVNEPPQLPASVILSVFENSFANTLVGTVTGTDPDAGDSLSYTITNGNTAGAFEINPNTGVIRVLNPAALDFETQPVFTLTVEATDQQGLKATSTVTVNVANLNEAPTLGSTAETISEAAANGTLVGQAIGSDPDANDTLTYSIIGGNDGDLFQINPTTGEITVANSVGLDFETQPTITLTIEVRDADGLTSTATAVIELTDANEAPQLALNGEPVAYGKKTNKKTGPVTILPSVTMTDPDLSPTFRLGGGTLTLSIDLAGKQTKKEFKAYDTVSGITNLTSIGSLISSQQVDGREVTVIQLNSTTTAVDVQNWLRSLRFSTKGKGLKQTTRQLTVQATDNGGLTSNLLQQTIHVSNE